MRKGNSFCRKILSFYPSIRTHTPMKKNLEPGNARTHTRRTQKPHNARTCMHETRKNPVIRTHTHLDISTTFDIILRHFDIILRHA